MATLSQYLTETGTTQEVFAKKLGVHQSTVSRLLEEGPRTLAMARRVEVASGGAVPAYTWLVQSNSKNPVASKKVATDG